MNKSVKTPLIRAPLSPDLLEKMDAYWRAANYLTVGLNRSCRTIRCSKRL